MSEIRKFAVVFLAYGVSYSLRFFEVAEVAKVFAFSILANIYLPLLKVLAPPYSGFTRRICVSNSAVSGAFKIITNPKIRATIIERLPRFSMISQSPILVSEAQNLSVHVDGTLRSVLLGFATERVVGTSVRIPAGAPIHSREPFIVFGINDGRLTLSKGNISDRLILRLNNFVSDSTRHTFSLSGKEIVRVQPHLCFQGGL